MKGGVVRDIMFIIGGGKMLCYFEGLQVVPARPTSKGTAEARYKFRK